MNIADIPAYCITIDKTNRRRAVKAQRNILQMGFESFQFVDGVVGKTLQDDYVKTITSPRAYYDIITDVRYSHETLSGLPSIGCYLSHVNLWKTCVNLNRTIAIFEDDISSIINNADLSVIYKDATFHNFDILKLTYFGSNNIIQNHITPNIIRLTLEYSTGGYIITPKTASILLKYAFPIETHVDQYMNFIAIKYNLNIFGSPRKYALYTNAMESTIQHKQISLHPDFHYLLGLRHVEHFGDINKNKDKNKSKQIYKMILFILFLLMTSLYLTCK